MTLHLRELTPEERSRLEKLAHSRTAEPRRCKPSGSQTRSTSTRPWSDDQTATLPKPRKAFQVILRMPRDDRRVDH